MPASVRELVAHGHEVLVETGAAERMGISDDDYRRAGAKIAANAAEVFASADLIVKVKEPQAAERAMLREGQTLFTYLHLAPDPEQAKDLMRSGVTAIAYETVTGVSGGLPLLSPMSEVAGRMSIQAGAHCLEMEQGGRGMLLGGSAGVAPANVVVIGGGVSGVNAVRMAIGLEAAVTCIDINIERLYALDQRFGASVNTIFSTRQAIEDYVLQADLVIGARAGAGCRGAQADHRGAGQSDEARLGHRRHLDRSGRLLRDVAADDACQSDLREAWRRALLRRQHAGRRGAYLDLRAQQRDASLRAGACRQGNRAALRSDPHLLAGLNVYEGKITYAAVAEALGAKYVEPLRALGK